MVEGGIKNSQKNSDVFYGLPLWQEVANNLGGAMTGKDHPCANKPIVFGSFIQHLARPSYLPRPSELVSKCEIQTKVGQLAVQVNLCQKLLFLHQLTYNMTTDCSLNYKFNT